MYTTPHLDNGERWQGHLRLAGSKRPQAIMKTDFNIRVYLDATIQPIFEKMAIGEPARSITHSITF
jgi:hypothetical protein